MAVRLEISWVFWYITGEIAREVLETVAHTVYTIVMRDTQRKGDIAVAYAITTFTTMGYDVALPITESAAYDLIVDTGERLARVQVRFTGGSEVDLRRVHSNSQGYVVKKSKENAYDWLYILKSSGEKYLIKECLHQRRSVNPTAQYLIT